MVKRFLTILHKEISGLHQAAYLLAFLSICSQILALFRDRLLASYFGASTSLDLYYAAFRIPDFIFITVGSTVSVSVLIPFIIERFKKDDDNGKAFLSGIFSFFFFVITLVCGATFFFVPFLSKKLFPGFSESELGQVVSLTRILLLSPFFLGLSNIFGTLTQIYKRFALYAISPVLYNLGIIFGIIFLYPHFGLKGLAFGVIFGAFLHFIVQVPLIAEHKMLPKFVKFNLSELKQVLFVSVPRTITLGSDNISMMFLISFASTMLSGSIAVFNFSYNLQNVPLSIIGISYSLAAFPVLVSHYLQKDIKKFIEQVVMSARHVIFWSLPVAVIFIVLRAQIIRTILGSGHFNWYNTRLTAAALALFAISIVFQNITLLLVRAFYAAGNTKTPFIGKSINAILTVILGFGLMKLYSVYPPFKYFLENVLRVRDIPGTIVLTLPLGWSIGEFFNMFVLWVSFEKYFKGFSSGIIKTLLQTILSSASIGFTSYFLLNFFDNFFDLTTTFGVFLQGFCAGIIGIFVGIIVLLILKNEEISEIWSAIHKKIWSKPILGPDASMEG